MHKKSIVHACKITLLWALMAASLPGSAHSNPASPVEIPALFSDNMVLQQNFAVPFWGKGTPGDRVTVKGGWGESAVTIVQTDRSWKTLLKTYRAGGPYEVSIAVGDTTIVCRNVMLGEVWVCSGQSNMELTLEGSLMSPVDDSAKEIEAATYPDIRFFTVGRAFAARPKFNCYGSWSECSPATAAKFSAVGFFFARRLYQELRVPIGVINASWGGTYIQSWMSGKVLSSLPGYGEKVARIELLQEDIEKRNAWVRSHASMDVQRDLANTLENINFEDQNCPARDFNDGNWELMKLPTFWWETALRDFDGAVWFRKKLEIPKAWVNSQLEIQLGRIHGMDETWINGKKVGGSCSSGYLSVPRVYEVPRELVKDSTVTIALRIVDIDPGGETWGDGSQFQVFSQEDTSKKISLAGEWKYLPVAEYLRGKFYVYGVMDREFQSRPRLPFDIGPNSPTTLYNGMISPIMPCAIKGAIWYQGESNADVPDNYNNYQTHFSLFISNWRRDWGQGDFPFYWVQIAPWNYWQGWNSYMIRDAQRRTLSLPNTGMAVTLDIGSLSSIHPPNKEDVGLRLALWALAKDYAKRVAYSGPLYQSMTVRKGKAYLTFTHTDGGLVLKPLNSRTNFIIAGRDSVFVQAEVKVSGKILVVFSPSVKRPAAVRYTWGNAEEATLFNKAGLPASTFRTDGWNR